MKIIDDINNLFHSLLGGGKTASEVSRIFGYERKWVYQRTQLNSFVVNDRFIAGLDCLGYELVLRKKEK